MALTYGSALLKKNAAESFWNTYFSIPDPFDRLVYETTTTQKTETYTWLNGAPMPQEWVGDRNAKDSPETSFDVTNKDWDATVRVDKDLEEYQQWDEVRNLTGNLGYKARVHVAKRLTTILEEGFTETCEDGQYFFDDDHAVSGAEYTTTQDNDHTTAITAATDPTAAEFAAAIRTKFDAFWSFKDAFGDPVVPMTEDLVGSAGDFVVMVPPGMLTVARQVLVADTLSAAGDNDLKGTYTLRVNPFLASGAQFYMFYAGSNHKPFGVQRKQSVALDDEMEYMSGHYLYSAYWKGEVFYGQWRTAVSEIFTTA